MVLGAERGIRMLTDWFAFCPEMDLFVVWKSYLHAIVTLR